MENLENSNLISVLNAAPPCHPTLNYCQQYLQIVCSNLHLGLFFPKQTEGPKTRQHNIIIFVFLVTYRFTVYGNNQSSAQMEEDLHLLVFSIHS